MSANDRVRQNIRAVRKARGLDLAEVAVLLTKHGHRMSLQVLSKLETGRRGSVTVDDVVALAAVLDVPTDALMSAERICSTCGQEWPS